METHELIKALAADTRRPGLPIKTVWWSTALFAVLVAGLVFAVLLGPRADIADAVQTVRFCFKFVVTIALAATAFGLVRLLSIPEVKPGNLLPYLAIAPALAFLGVIIELIVVPSGLWSTRLVGANSLVCLTFIPTIGVGPLMLFLLVLRYGAPSHPGLAGAVAGLSAGAIAATFYASHCTDDSPLFVVTWYPIAFAVLALVGSVSAHRIARW